MVYTAATAVAVVLAANNKPIAQVAPTKTATESTAVSTNLGATQYSREGQWSLRRLRCPSYYRTTQLDYFKITLDFNI